MGADGAAEYAPLLARSRAMRHHAECSSGGCARLARVDLLDEMCAPTRDGDPILREALRGARGPFGIDDVAGVLASTHEDSSGGRPGSDVWIVRLGPGLGLPVGIVHATWRDHRKLKGAIGEPSAVEDVSIEACPSLLAALRDTRLAFETFRNGDALALLRRVSVDDRRAVGRLLDAGVILLHETRDHEDAGRGFPPVTSLIGRLDDTYDEEHRVRDPDGETFGLGDARHLWMLHALDPVHGVRAWCVAQRRAAPRLRVSEEMRAAGYDVAKLAQGAAPLVALRLAQDPAQHRGGDGGSR